MVKNADNIRIYGGDDDTLWLAPIGTTAPVGLEEPGAGFEDVGYFSEAGLDRARDQSVTDFRVHQGGKIVRRKVTESSETITFRAVEENGVTTELGENIVSEVVTAGVRTRTMSTAGEVKVRAGVLDKFDTVEGVVRQKRNIYPRLEITGGGTVTWSKDNMTEREFTAAVIGDYYEIDLVDTP